MFDDPPAALILAEVEAARAAGLAPGFARKVADNALGIAERELAATFPLAAGQDAMEDMILATLAKLAVDQPGYPGFRALVEAMKGAG